MRALLEREAVGLQDLLDAFQLMRDRPARHVEHAGKSVNGDPARPSEQVVEQIVDAVGNVAREDPAHGLPCLHEPDGELTAVVDDEAVHTVRELDMGDALELLVRPRHVRADGPRRNVQCAGACFRCHGTFVGKQEHYVLDRMPHRDLLTRPQ